MQEAARDLVVLSNEAGEVMILSVDGWGGDPLPSGVMLRPVPGGVAVLASGGTSLGLAPAEAEPALRGARDYFLGHAGEDGIVTDRHVAAAFLGT